MNREDLAWAAGFFDGEGHVGLVVTGKRREHRHLHIQVCQTQDGPLERLQQVIGGKLYGPYKASKLGRRPYKQLHLDKFEVVQYAICLMWPWLSAPKRMQIKKTFKGYHEYLARPYVPRGPRPKERHVA